MFWREQLFTQLFCLLRFVSIFHLSMTSLVIKDINKRKFKKKDRLFSQCPHVLYLGWSDAWVSSVYCTLSVDC